MLPHPTLEISSLSLSPRFPARPSRSSLHLLRSRSKHRSARYPPSQEDRNAALRARSRRRGDDAEIDVDVIEIAGRPRQRRRRAFSFFNLDLHFFFLLAYLLLQPRQRAGHRPRPRRPPQSNRQWPSSSPSPASAACFPLLSADDKGALRLLFSPAQGLALQRTQVQRAGPRDYQREARHGLLALRSLG